MSKDFEKKFNCDILLLNPTIVELAQSQFFADMDEVMKIREKRQKKNLNNGFINSEMRVRARNPRRSFANQRFKAHKRMLNSARGSNSSASRSLSFLSLSKSAQFSASFEERKETIKREHSAQSLILKKSIISQVDAIFHYLCF